MSGICDNFRDKIAGLIGGDLHENETVAVQKHITECKDCAEFELILRAEDKLLTHLFESFDKDLQRQEDEVIKAIGCFELTLKDRVLTAVRTIIDNPMVKLAGAAAVIVFITFNCVRAMTWLYELERFMNICSITVR